MTTIVMSNDQLLRIPAAWTAWVLNGVSYRRVGLRIEQLWREQWVSVEIQLPLRENVDPIPVVGFR